VQRQTILRCFIPTNIPSWNESGGHFDTIDESAFPDNVGLMAHLGKVRFDFDVVVGSQRLASTKNCDVLSVSKVSRGDELLLERPGHRTHRQQFDHSGLAIDIALPSGELGLAAKLFAGARGVGLSVEVQTLDGKWKISNEFGEGFRERCYHATNVRIRRISLTDGSDKVPGTSVSVIE
jgi:hypothetical protein